MVSVEVVTVTESTENHEAYEVVVVGGGAAGLSAALVLGRARRRTLVVDAGEPRNAPSSHMQGYLSRDGMPPAEFLAAGREEVARYGVELVRGRVVDVRPGFAVGDGPGFGVAVEAGLGTDAGPNPAADAGPDIAADTGPNPAANADPNPAADIAPNPAANADPNPATGVDSNLAADVGPGFVVTLAGGRTVRARRLVVATGLKDELPAVPGVAERFGRDVLHCPFCHGWEVRDQPFGVLATGPASVHQALMVSQWSKDVRLFLHTLAEEDLPGQDLRRLAAAGVQVVPGEVAALVVEDDRLTGVRLADGTTHARSALFTAPRPVPQTGLLERLGAELNQTPFGAYPVVDQTGRTTVPRVWAAGNAVGFAEQVVHAASGGYRAAAAIVGDLLMADLDAAVQAEVQET
ncbi:NAD(P)/FAD-dependent oxidoreductase [Streptomyces sp. NPDC052682]|uniref:NAD(P)/FAD-dependent oxidoreductase n=1 Tax=Streptomyces sp. NPDC052682 TaxID=3154954 RepID=UPI0034454CCE